VRSADVAPTLPLIPIDAEELAAKPKAEGFRALGLNEQILADLAAMGWQDPTPVQAGVISLLMSGKDVIGQAQTGSGKTGAFVLPILNKLYSLEGQGPIALILCPTRELARQVHSECIRMSGTSGARSTVIYGGVSLDDQVESLARQPHIVVGTPGRIIDHIRRRTLDLSRLKIAVMDEADQMLDIGFLPDIEFILKHTPPTKQVMLFSATMPPEILALVNKFMKDQQHINLLPIIPTVEQVDQKYIAVDHDKKTMLLAHFIEQHNPERLIVFCRTKHQVDRVTEVLKRKKMKAAAIHGDLPQSKREKTLEAFRSGDLPSLVATNVAARGLDIPTVSHVVNYDIPETPEEYVHRIGRTARNGAPGIARTFVTPEDGQFIVGIEKHIGLLLEEEIVEGITVSTATAVVRTIAQMPIGTPKLLKPIIGGIKLGRRRR
jgi:ATP-dependent RNA helicase DeaD